MGLVSIEESTLTGIADAIRTQLGTSSTIPTPDMKEKILSIVSGGGDVYGIDSGEFKVETDTPLSGYTFQHKLKEVPTVILVYADDYSKLPNNADTKVEFALEVPACPLFSIRAKRYLNNQYNGYNDDTPFTKTPTTVSFNSNLTGYIFSKEVTYKWVVMSTMCSLFPSEWNVAHGSFIGDGSTKIIIPNPRATIPRMASIISESNTIGYCQRSIILYNYGDSVNGMQTINNSAGAQGILSASNMSADNNITETEIVFASRGGNYTFKSGVKYDYWFMY